MYAKTVSGDDGRMDGYGYRIPGPEKCRLSKAWKAAHYFVSAGWREWLFIVGQTAPEVERQLPAREYLFITAWNPPPGESSRESNLRADERLQARLAELKLAHYPALGCDAHGSNMERGWLVLDAPLHTADMLAREFGQGGTLYWPTEQPVRLRMMWARPDTPGDDEYTDWVG